MSIAWKMRVFMAILLLLLLSRPMSAQDVSEPVRRLYSEAKSEEQQNHLGVATQKYLQIVAISPELAAAQNNLGRLYFLQAQYDKAIPPLEKACRLAPELAAPHSLLGLSLFQTGDYEGAQKELELAQKLDPNNAQVKLFLARSLVERGDLDGAVKILQALQEVEPSNSEVLYTLGFVYSSLAEAAFHKIMEIDPSSYLMELLRGKAAEAQKLYVDAAEHYKNAINKAPTNWELYYRYGHVLYGADQPQDALAAYRHAMFLNPHAYDAEWEAARILVTENPEEAYELTTQALQGKPDLPAEVLVIRGRALLSLKRPKEAAEDLKKACSKDPNDQTCHFQLAHAYQQMGLTQEAKEEYATYERMEKEWHDYTEQQAAKHLVPPEQLSQKEPRPQ